MRVPFLREVLGNESSMLSLFKFIDFSSLFLINELDTFELSTVLELTLNEKLKEYLLLKFSQLLII
jgi:hypothetical protein